MSLPVSWERPAASHLQTLFLAGFERPGPCLVGALAGRCCLPLAFLSLSQSATRVPASLWRPARLTGVFLRLLAPGAIAPSRGWRRCRDSCPPPPGAGDTFLPSHHLSPGLELFFSLCPFSTPMFPSFWPQSPARVCWTLAAGCPQPDVSVPNLTCLSLTQHVCSQRVRGGGVP